jgi:UDP-N-acetylmuramoyl-L-alanyl-D-glutamate--2,6-diaminopimelate ligase
MLPNHYPVTSHTKHIGHGTTFIAIKGMKEDGVTYIPEALRLGARTVVIEDHVMLPQEITNEISKYNATLLRVPHARAALAQLSAQALGFPSKKLKIIAVTGTKGKSTTTFLIEHMLSSSGYKTALLSTVKNRILEHDLETHLTTQHPDYLHVFFDLCVQHKVDYVIMEVAAQALTLHRVDTLQFDAVVFTNFSQEHAEFYATNDDYFEAKKQILKHIKDTCPLFLNADDNRVAELASLWKNVLFFSTQNAKTDFNADLHSSSIAGLTFEIAHKNGKFTVHVPALMGGYNVSNCAAASACVKSLGLSDDQIERALSTFSGVPGRLNRYMLPNKAIAFIDYAHNPSSFKAVLSTLRPLSSHLVVVFGAGGDRDPIKRPLMGDIAAQYADRVILTTDNPRSENPEDITEQIHKGIPENMRHKVVVELDREKAIHQAYQFSAAQSVIALLGKGPDEYQLVKGVKIPFSESKILQSFT